MGQGQIGVLFPVDTDSKTGRPVMDVLRDKHLAMRTPDLVDPECSSFEEYEEDSDVVPLDITKEDVMWVAGKLLGSAGLSGAYAMVFQSWLVRFGQSSESIREEMVSWTDWLANESPLWLAYRAIMSEWMVALDKCLGVRPVVIREMCHRLFSKLVL